MALSTKEYIVSVLGMPLSDDDKAVLIMKLLNAALAQQAPAAPAPSPAAPQPAAPAPAPIPPTPPRGVTWHAGPDGERIDDICEPGTPGTWTSPVTKHTISLPQRDKGELAMGYLNRVHLQCGVPEGSPVLGALATLGIQAFGSVAAQNHLDLRLDSTWAELADRLFNAPAYMTESQKAVFADNAAQFAEQAKHYGSPAAPQPTDSGSVPIEGVQG